MCLFCFAPPIHGYQIRGLSAHLLQPDLEYERSHLGDPGRPPPEALQVVRSQYEEPLLPPGEQLVALLPHQALQQASPRALLQEFIHNTF